MSSGNYFQLFHYPKSTLFWYDDFVGSVLDTRWNSTGSAGGSAVLVDQQTNGVCRITTHTDANDWWYIDWTVIRPLLVTKNVQMEVRILVSSTANIGRGFALRFDDNNQILFYCETALGHVNWYGWSVSGGVTTSANSGIAADTNYHIFQIQTHTHGSNHAHFFIDGVEIANSPITTNVPASYLQPYFLIVTRIVASSKSMDIDYVAVTQNI